MFRSFLLVLFVAAASVTPSTCQSTVIKHPYSGLVLDASQHVIQLQHFTGMPSQLWTLDQAGLGKYIIINKGNGKVMDINGGIIPEANVITSERHGGTNQQWYINSDNTIVIGTGNLAVDIQLGKYIPGAPIIAHAKHGAANQLFSLQYH